MTEARLYGITPSNATHDHARQIYSQMIYSVLDVYTDTKVPGIYTSIACLSLGHSAASRLAMLIYHPLIIINGNNCFFNSAIYQTV